MLKDRTNNGISLIERANRIPFIVAGISRCLEYSNKWNKSINGLAFLQIIYKLLCDVPSRPRFFSLSLSLFLCVSLSPRNLDRQNIERLESFVLAPSLRNSNVQWRESVSTIIFRRYSHSARDRTQTFLNRVVRSIDPSRSLFSKSRREREREREREKKILSEAFVLTSIKSIRVDAEMHDIVISFMNDKLRSKPWILSNVFNARDCN